MSTGQIVGGGIGAYIGAALAVPTGGQSILAAQAIGALYGAQLGIMAGGVLDPPKGPTVEGPRLSDLSVQTSTYGQFIPRTYGTIGLSGNVFWLENNKIKEVVKKEKSGGKGGGSSSTVKTYTYFATFAVGLCEGPIAGVRRIWVGPDLVYDAGSDDLETIISSNHASAKFTIYTGTDTQQPDPRMQAEMGVANCPAFRGLAYIVVKDLKLTNYGNSVAGAQVKAEIVKAGNVVKTIIDIDPATITSFTYESVGFPLEDMHGLKIIDNRKAVYTDGVASFTKREFNLGTLTNQSAPVIISDINNTELVAGLRSNDGKLWWQYKSNDTFTNESYLRSEDGYWIGLDGFRRAQDMLLMSETLVGPETYQYNYAFTYASSTGAENIIDRIGISAVKKNQVAKSIIISSLSQSSGWNVSTSGDEPYQWRISGNTFSVRIYDISLSSIVDQFSISLPAGQWPDVVSGSSYGVSDNVCCFLKNRTAYIVLREVSSGYRYAGINSTGVLFNYSFTTFDISETGIVAVWPNDADQAIIQTRNRIIQWRRSSYGESSVEDIFNAECLLSGILSQPEIDAEGVTDVVTGYKVTTTGSIRNAIEPLRGAWPFDVVQSGYKIKATSRGSASVVTIPIGELAIDTQLTESREMDSQLPQNVTVKYIDRDRDYDQNEQRAQRDNTEAVNSLVLELPVVLSATQSAQVADKLIRIYALEKSDFSFTLPAPYRYLEPGDVVTIAATDADYVLRLVSVNQTADGRLECAGRPSSAATYTSIAPGDGGQQGTVTIPLAGATVGLIVDCPVIDEGLQDAPGFAVGMNGYSAGWPGGILYRTADGGQTWDDLQALDGRATAGYAAGLLSASAGNLIQRGGSLTVSLIGGTLESVTEAQMLNGANIAAYGVNGRWEILRFQNATLNVDGTYTLDTFWRGDKGTEWATGLHAANDIFVLMTDPDLAFVGMPTDSIGQPRDYRAVTAGADIDSAASQAFTYSAVNLETLSGVHPRGSRIAGDLTITWQRRTRVGGAWRDFVDASLGEATESYEVDIMDGATVKRTITATTPSVLYTSAMQVTDFGSPQASVTVNIYQLSAVVGRGYKLEATL